MCGDMDEERGRRLLCGSVCLGVCVCVMHRDSYKTRTSRFREGGLGQALFPVAHSSGDLVTPVPSQPES